MLSRLKNLKCYIFLLIPLLLITCYHQKQEQTILYKTENKTILSNATIQVSTSVNLYQKTNSGMGSRRLLPFYSRRYFGQ